MFLLLKVVWLFSVSCAAAPVKLRYDADSGANATAPIDAPRGRIASDAPLDGSSSEAEVPVEERAARTFSPSRWTAPTRGVAADEAPRVRPWSRFPRS